MSSLVFDAGDMQRLDRERSLTEEAPRQLPETDRSPEEDLSILNVRDEPENDFDIMLDGILAVLKERL